MIFNIRTFLPLAVAATLLMARPARADFTFSLNDGTADPTSGTYSPGSTFTLAVTLNSTGQVNGYSLWFDTATGNANFFSIGGFTLASSSPFSAESGSGNGPQNFDTANAGRPGFQSNLNDLGATTASGGSVAAGSYLVENTSFLISSSAAPGTYTIQTTPPASGGRASGGVNPDFSFTQAPSAIYTITVVPEPATLSMLIVGGIACLGAGVVRHKARQS